MSDGERMLALTAARWCSAGATLAWLSLAISAAAFAALAFDRAHGAAAWALWIAAALGGIGAWYRFRLLFDAGVFGDIAGPEGDEGISSRAAAFDASLAALLGRDARAASRPLAERARGAHRLVARAGAIVVMQLAAALFAVFPR